MLRPDRFAQVHADSLDFPARIEKDEPGGPGSDWGSSKVLAISLSLAAVLVLPLFVCLARRCYLTSRRKREQKRLATAHADDIIKSRAAAAREAAEAGDAGKAAVLEAELEAAKAQRDAASSHHEEPVSHKTANLLDVYTDSEPYQGAQPTPDGAEHGPPPFNQLEPAAQPFRDQTAPPTAMLETAAGAGAERAAHPVPFAMDSGAIRATGFAEPFREYDRRP